MKNPGNQTPCHSLLSGGIICGPHRGSFAVQFGDHFRSGNHLRSGIICGAVQLFSYLKGLVNRKVKTAIDGLPFTTEGYQWTKNILKSKYGQMSEMVNACVQNIMELPVITGSHPKKIHEFYEKLLLNVQSLEALGKLNDRVGT